MIELKGVPSCGTITLAITRAATGLTEEITLDLHALPETPDQPVTEEEPANGCHSLD